MSRYHNTHTHQHLRWKLHLRPKHLESSINKNDDLPPLPPGKNAVDVLTDFIKYLFNCAKDYIQKYHPAMSWSTVENSIKYVFTHSNGWEGVQQQMYRQAIERAGLAPSTPEGRTHVHMLTEGKASLHFCIANLLIGETADQADPQGVVISVSQSSTKFRCGLTFNLPIKLDATGFKVVFKYTVRSCTPHLYNDNHAQAVEVARHPQ